MMVVVVFNFILNMSKGYVYAVDKLDIQVVRKLKTAGFICLTLINDNEPLPL